MTTTHQGAAPAALDVTASALVRRPVMDVAAHATDPETVQTWTPHVLGRRLPMGFEVVEATDGGLVLRTGGGPVAVEAVYSWEPVGTWTRLTLRSVGDAPGAGLAVPLIERAVQRAMSRDLARLTRSLEQAA